MPDRNDHRNRTVFLAAIALAALAIIALRYSIDGTEFTVAWASLLAGVAAAFRGPITPQTIATVAGTFAAGAAGSYLGAYGAQVVISRASERSEVAREIASENAAGMIAAAICNSLIGMKRQHIQRLKEDYDNQRKAFDAFQEQRKAGALPPGSVFHLKADFQTLDPVQFPTDMLQSQVFEKSNLVGRPLSMTITLGQTLHSLNGSLAKRNSLIAAISQTELSPEDLARIYFGLPTGQGHQDMTYPMIVDAIASYTDDSIHFSHTLTQDILSTARQGEAAFRKRFKRPGPRVASVDFSKAKGFFPDPANYKDWETGFPAAP